MGASVSACYCDLRGSQDASGALIQVGQASPVATMRDVTLRDAM